MPRLIDETEVTSIDSTWYIPVVSQTGVNRILPGNLPFLQSGTGAVAEVVQAKLRERVTPFDFGAIADGSSHPLSGSYGTLAAAQVKYPFVTSLTQEIDYAACQAAINTGKSVEFVKGAGNYFLGTYNTASQEVNVLTAVGVSNVSYRGDGVLQATSANTCVPKILELDNAHDIDIDLVFNDPGYDEAATWQGAMFVNLLGSTGVVYNIRGKVRGTGGICAVNTGNQNATVPTFAIYKIGIDVEVTNVFYGAQFRNCGDHVQGTVKTTNAHRSYFVYGGQHHKIDVFSKNHSNVNAAQDVLIKVYDGRDTQDIEVNYRCQGFTTATPPVEIENQTTSGKAVRDVTVTINDSDSTNTNTQTCYICSRDVNGNILSSSANVLTNIKIGGHMRWVPQFGTTVSGGVINYVELFGDVARKITAPNQIILGTTKASNPGFDANVGWRLRMPDGKTWVIYHGNNNNAVINVPLTAANSMGVMAVDYDVYDGYQSTAIWKHGHECVIWTMSAGVATLSSHTVEYHTDSGAVGSVNPAASGGNIQWTFAGWTAAANGLIVFRYEDQQSDSATAD